MQTKFQRIYLFNLNSYNKYAHCTRHTYTHRLTFEHVLLMYEYESKAEKANRNSIMRASLSLKAKIVICNCIASLDAFFTFWIERKTILLQLLSCLILKLNISVYQLIVKMLVSSIKVYDYHVWMNWMNVRVLYNSEYDHRIGEWNYYHLQIN